MSPLQSIEILKKKLIVVGGIHSYVETSTLPHLRIYELVLYLNFERNYMCTVNTI